MKNFMIAGVSVLAIMSASVSFAQSQESLAVNNTKTQSESGAVAVVNGDNINSRGSDPTAIAPNLAGLYASPHTCMGSSTASVGINGVFSMGAGSTWQDDECNKREAVKLAAQLGLKQAAAAVFYDIGVVKAVIGEAENADLRAQQEAQQLAGIKMSARPAAQKPTSNINNAPATTGPDYNAWRGNDRD